MSSNTFDRQRQAKQDRMDQLEADRHQRQKAKERTQARRKAELRAAGPQRDANGKIDRHAHEQQIAAKEAIRREHRAEDWDNNQRHRHRMYEYYHGSGAQRRGIAEMERHSRKRERDLDYIRRVQAGEAEYEGNNLIGDTKVGPHWSQGSMDAYEFYKENIGDIKRGNIDFYYNDYVPKPGQKDRPSYEHYMGQYYDPNYGNSQYGNPYRASSMPKPGEPGFVAGHHAR